MTIQENKTWYTIQELAQTISVSQNTIWHWINNGKLRSTRYGQRHRIDKADWQACFDRFNKNAAKEL